MSEIIFPTNVVDGTTFFHGDTVCLYHEADNTWECRSVVSETAQPPNQNVYVTTSKVYALGDKRNEWQTKLNAASVNYTIEPIRSQEDINAAFMDLICYMQQYPTEAAGNATQAYVDQQIAAIPTGTVSADVPTRAEFNALVTTVMAAIANSVS